MVDAVDVADVQARVARHVATHPGPGWVVGAGYPPEILPGGVGEAGLLDAVAPHRPVALWASDHHTLWVNSAALAACAIDASTPDPPLGTIPRGGDGRPIGTLLEAATHLVERQLPSPSREDKGRGLALALERMGAAGIVWGQEAALAPDDVGVYLDLAGAGKLTATIDIALRSDPLRWRAQRDEFRAARERASGVPGVSVRTVKFFADGIIEAGTGALLEPYADDPCSCGIPNWAPEELAEAARAFDRDGFGLHTHAIGDAGVRMALDAVEGCVRAAGTTARPPVVAHTQLVHPDDLSRFAELGVVANTSSPCGRSRTPS